MAFNFQYGTGAMLSAISADQRYRAFQRERDFAFDRERFDTQVRLQEEDRSARNRRQLSQILQQKIRDRAARSAGPSELEMLHERTKAQTAATQAEYDANRSDRGFVDPDGGAYSNQHVLPDGRVLSGPQAAASQEYQQYKQDKRLGLIDSDDTLSSTEKRVAKDLIRQRQMVESAQEDNRPPAAKQMELQQEFASSTFEKDGVLYQRDPKGRGFTILRDRDSDGGGGGDSFSVPQRSGILRDAQRSIRDEMYNDPEFGPGYLEDGTEAPYPPLSDPIVMERAKDMMAAVKALASPEEQIAMSKEDLERAQQEVKFQELATQLGVDPSESRGVLPKQRVAPASSQQGVTPVDEFMGNAPSPGDPTGEFGIDPANAEQPQADIPQNQPPSNVVPFGNNPSEAGVVGPEGHIEEEQAAIEKAYAESPEKGDAVSVGIDAWKIGSGVSQGLTIDPSKMKDPSSGKGKKPSAADVLNNSSLAVSLNVKLRQLEREGAPQEAVDLAISDAIALDQKVSKKRQRDIDKAWAYGFVQAFTNATDGYNRELAKEYVSEKWGSYEKGVAKVWGLAGEFISEMLDTDITEDLRGLE